MADVAVAGKVRVDRALVVFKKTNDRVSRQAHKSFHRAAQWRKSEIPDDRPPLFMQSVVPDFRSDVQIQSPSIAARPAAKRKITAQSNDAPTFHGKSRSATVTRVDTLCKSNEVSKMCRLTRIPVGEYLQCMGRENNRPFTGVLENDTPVVKDKLAHGLR